MRQGTCYLDLPSCHIADGETEHSTEQHHAPEEHANRTKIITHEKKDDFARIPAFQRSIKPINATSGARKVLSDEA